MKTFEDFLPLLEAWKPKKLGSNGLRTGDGENRLYCALGALLGDEALDEFYASEALSLAPILEKHGFHVPSALELIFINDGRRGPQTPEKRYKSVIRGLRALVKNRAWVRQQEAARKNGK